MSSDLKLFRKRWWGFYALTPVLALAVLAILSITVENFTNGKTIGGWVGITVIVACVLLILGLYAPYTFFNCFRFLGLLAFASYVAYLIDMISSGTFISFSRSVPSALYALKGLLVWGLPGLLYFLYARRKEVLSNWPTHVQFTSNAFPPYPGEDEEINPGVWGKRLAEFIVAKLPEHGIATEEFHAEDWGWEISVKNEAFPIYIGCSNQIEPGGTKFLCFITPCDSEVRIGLFKKVNTETDVTRVADALDKILSRHSDVRDLRWLKDNEK